MNIPGSLGRSSSFNSSSSLSTSPLSSLSQSLSQSLLAASILQQNHTSNMLAKQEHGLLGTPTSSSQNSLGEPRASGILFRVSWEAFDFRFESQSYMAMEIVELVHSENKSNIQIMCNITFFILFTKLFLSCKILLFILVFLLY